MSNDLAALVKSEGLKLHAVCALSIIVDRYTTYYGDDLPISGLFKRKLQVADP